MDTSNQSQAQVISRGMRWTPEMAQTALNNHYYIKVGEKSSQLQITGAPNRWKKEGSANDIYIPSARIAGAPDVVRTVLENSGYDPKQIEELFGGAYTKSNYNTDLKDQFEQECEEYNAFKKENTTKSAETKEPTVRLAHLDVLVANLPQAETSKTVRKSVASGEAKKGGVRGAKTPLKERLDTLPAGKVLDVSAMNEMGSGVKSIIAPGANSSKKGVPELPIVSATFEKFEEAMKMLGPEYLVHCDKYKQLAAVPAPAKVKPVAKAAPVQLRAPAAKAPAKAAPAPAAVKQAAPMPVAAKPAPVAAKPVAVAPVAAAVKQPVPSSNLKQVPRVPVIGSPRKN